jgi:hypothetical protein
MKRTTRLMLTCAMLLGACGASLEGNGDVSTEDRVVAGFDALDADNGVAVSLTIDPTIVGDTVLAVTTDSNLQEFLTTKVSSGTLRVTTDRSGGVTPTSAFDVSGTVPDITNVKADNGAAVTVTGSAGEVTFSVNNGATVDAETLAVTTVSVNADNGAEIAVCATGAVSGSAKNGARVTVFCGGSFDGVETSDGGTVSSAP